MADGCGQIGARQSRVRVNIVEHEQPAIDLLQGLPSGLQQLCLAKLGGVQAQGLRQALIVCLKRLESRARSHQISRSRSGDDGVGECGLRLADAAKPDDGLVMTAGSHCW